MIIIKGNKIYFHKLTTSHFIFPSIWKFTNILLWTSQFFFNFWNFVVFFHQIAIVFMKSCVFFRICFNIEAFCDFYLILNTYYSTTAVTKKNYNKTDLVLHILQPKRYKQFMILKPNQSFEWNMTFAYKYQCVYSYLFGMSHWKSMHKSNYRFFSNKCRLISLCIKYFCVWIFPTIHSLIFITESFYHTILHNKKPLYNFIYDCVIFVILYSQ